MKSPGQLAHETDVYRAPLYHDGTDRKTWEQLPSWAKQNWEKYPTQREYRKPRDLADMRQIFENGDNTHRFPR